MILLFLYSYENEFLNNIIRSGQRRLARSFYLFYRYNDDLIFSNNKMFLDYLSEINQVTWQAALILCMINSGGKMSPRFMTKVMILTPTLSSLHSFLTAYHLVLLTVNISRKS